MPNDIRYKVTIESESFSCRHHWVPFGQPPHMGRVFGIRPLQDRTHSTDVDAGSEKVFWGQNNRNQGTSFNI